MAGFARSEMEEQFARFFNLGCVLEDWNAWVDLFTDDARYVEHFWGELHGPAEIRAWINPVMAGVPEIYTVLDWYLIDGDKAVWSMQNRRDNPDPGGEPAYFDFAGLSVAQYAGDGRWCYEEDYWDVRGARATASAYAEVCARVDPDLETKMSRRFWPDGPSWARLDGPAAPSWLDREGVTPITKPSELRALLAPLRGGGGS
jgi:hypothetical protein